MKRVKECKRNVRISKIYFVSFEFLFFWFVCFLLFRFVCLFFLFNYPKYRNLPRITLYPKSLTIETEHAKLKEEPLTWDHMLS